MKPSTISRLVSKGILPSDPRFLKEAEKLETENHFADQKRRKENVCLGYVRTKHLTAADEIRKWLRTDGRPVRIGYIQELEVWENANARLLCVLKTQWEAYRLSLENPAQLCGRLV